MSESVYACLLGLLKHAHQRRLDLKCLQQVDLLLCLREAVQDPALHSAVSLLQTLFDQGANDLVRDNSALVYASLDRFPCWSASGYLML